MSHIDLEPDGLAGQWVDIVDVGTKSPNQFKRIRAFTLEPSEVAKLPEDEARAVMREFYALVVSAWCVNDPDTGSAVPAPTSADLDPGAIPRIVTARVQAEITGRIAEIEALKARSRSG